MSSVEEIAAGRLRIQELAPFLDAEKNILLAGGRVLTRDELTSALLNFAALSSSLPNILRTAAHCCVHPSLQDLRDEIALNLSEELGEIEALPGMEGQSHYSILRSELASLLNIDVDGKVISRGTTSLISCLLGTVQLGDATTFGALLALETTAIPEILIFKAAVLRFARAEAIHLPARLISFFDVHTSQFEVEHAARLCALHATVNGTPNAQKRMAFGFDQVVRSMTEWWDTMLE